MFKFICVFALLFSFTVSASANILQRLKDADSNAEEISTELLSKPAASLSEVDWLALSTAQLKLRHKEAAMEAVNRALTSNSSDYLLAHGYLLKAQIYGILYRDTEIAITQLLLAEQSVINAEDKDSKELYSDILQSFAQAYNQLGDVQKALPYAKASLVIAQELKQAETELKARITLGRLHLQNNAVNEATLHFYEALDIATSLNDLDAIASLNFRLGMAYRKIEDHENALTHLLEAKQRFKTLNNNYNHTASLLYIGETYLEDIKTEKQAKDALTKALARAEEANSLTQIGLALQGLGRHAALVSDDKLALEYFNKAQHMFRQQNIKTYLHEGNLALGELHFKSGQFAIAQSLVDELAPHVSDIAGYLQQRYHNLALKLAKHNQNWQQAFLHQERAMLLNEELTSERSKQQIERINNEFSLIKNNEEHKAEIQKLSQLLFNEQEQKNKLLLISLILFGLLTVYVAVQKIKQLKSVAPAKPVYSGWNNFTYKVQQQSAKSEVILIALAPTRITDVKFKLGSQALSQIMQSVIEDINNKNLVTSCVIDDVAWVAITLAEDEISSLQKELTNKLNALLPENLNDVVSLQLSLKELANAPWQMAQLDSIPEAFWLSWKLATLNQTNPESLIISMHSNTDNACVWSGPVARQDLLNAIRLGSIELYSNTTLLPATLADDIN